jgi:cell division protein FtsB
VAEVVASPNCPHCGAAVVVPKSTRSFICKSCDAILKAVRTESGYVLKLLGKSVDDDPEYQTLERDATELRQQVTQLHAEYLEVSGRALGKGAGRVALAGIVVILIGALVFVVDRFASAALVLVGGGMLLGGYLVRSRQIAQKKVEMGTLGEALERLARERDMLEARAAQMKVRT